jgi:ketosteroid isomerase-like protein
MPSANLDLVRSIAEAWERGDYEGTDWADPGIEFVMPDGPSAGSWTGVAGMAEGWRAFINVWDQVHGEAEEYRELDDERVLLLARFAGSGKTSGLDLRQIGARSATVFEIRDGKVVRLVHYWDRDRALTDLGLAS